MGERPIVICDIDGVIADCTHRLKFIESKPADWDAFFEACSEARQRQVSERIEFVAVGHPEPQGWLKAVSLPGRKFTTLIDGNPKLKRWRKTVKKAAQAAMNGLKPIDREIPLAAQLQFCFRRPASVKREHHTVKPDVDKLVRSVFDSLTGVVWTDDSQVKRITAAKHYGDFERVEIRVERMG